MEAGQCSLCRETHAKFACSCVLPSSSFCAVCIAVHLETEGAHMPVPIKKAQSKAPFPVQGNELCDECGRKTAACFCLCTTPVKKRCKDCDVFHYQKAESSTHSKHPITAYRAVAAGRVSLETFRKKQLYINDLQLRIGAELTQFDAFMRRVGEEFEALIEQVTLAKESLLQKLQCQRAKLTIALTAVQQTIESKRYEDSFEVVTALDDYLLNGYKDSREYELKMTTGKIEFQAMRDLLVKAVTFTLEENCLLDEIVRIMDIPVLKGNNLRLFNRETLQMTERILNQTTQINRCTAYCYIKNNILLCCGGETHSDVYEVNVQSGTVMQARSMNSIREFAGIFNLNGENVFVFGGRNSGGMLNSVEKYQLKGKMWSVIGSMQQAKRLCSVCQHSSGLYIAGYSDTTKQTTIEFFNQLNETFKLLYTVSGFSGILCCRGEELYHIRLNLIEAASLANSQSTLTFTQKATIPQVGNGLYWLRFPPSIIEGEAVGVLTAGGAICGLFRFNTATVQFTQIANFTY